ncbi:MAG: acyl carrier protein [Lachnospiraceae bacterium]|nr:acyl carrier protein [Lachnospiraceae bacterium]
MLEKISDIIKEQLNLDEGAEITEETSFKDDLGADSLDLFELVMALEEEYGMEIPAEELEALVTVGDVIEFIKSKDIDD